MYPIDEGNDECRKCEHFNMGMGCVPTHIKLCPPCGLDVAISQASYKELITKRKSLLERVGIKK